MASLQSSVQTLYKEEDKLQAIWAQQLQMNHTSYSAVFFKHSNLHFLGLNIHHVRAHAGELFAEIADVAAKQKAQQSFNLPRQSFDRTRWKVHFQQLWPFLEINMDYHHGDMAVWISNDQIYDHARCHNGMKSSGTIVTRHPALRVVLGLPTFNCTVDHKGMEGNCIVCNNKCACSISTAWPYRKGSLIRACPQPTTYYESVQVHLGPTMAVRFGSTLTCLTGTPIVTNPCCSCKDHIQVVHADSRRLLLRCDTGHFSFWALAGHAPHGGHTPEDRRQWWDEFHSIPH